MRTLKIFSIAALAVVGTAMSLSTANAGSCRGGSYGRGYCPPSYGYSPVYAPSYSYRPAYPGYYPCHGTPTGFPAPVGTIGVAPVAPVAGVAPQAIVPPVAGAAPVATNVVPAPGAPAPTGGVVNISPNGGGAPVNVAPANVTPVVEPVGTPVVPVDAPLPKIERTISGPGPVGPLTAYNVGLGPIGSQAAPEEVVSRGVIDLPTTRTPLVDE